MCGVVGAVRNNGKVVEFLLDGLKRMEYRGYDSSGIAVITAKGIERVRRVGRVAKLAEAVEKEHLTSNIGIGHTRWATHGGVTEPNAHPHISRNTIAVVHNGIIENFLPERERLSALGYVFESQTDTEVMAHSIHYEYQQCGSLFQAVKIATQRLRGAYAIGVIALPEPDKMVVARMGCPLLIGLGHKETFFASDVAAIVANTRDIVYLEDGDVGQISLSGIDRLEDEENHVVTRRVEKSKVSLTSLELGPYNHFMQKEIYEQPKAITDTTEVVFNAGFIPELFGEEAATIFAKIDSVKILACGGSYHTGLAAKYWLEAIAGLPTDVEIASEYRYRKTVFNPKQLIVTVSQSGETLDTLEALRAAQKQGHEYTLSICNVMESSLVRASRLVFYTRAGVEICVASTKAFTTQLTALFTLTVTLARLRKTISEKEVKGFLNELRHLPGSVQYALNLEPQIIQWARFFATKQNALFLGRGIHYPIALEGALKLKEITYIHAEGYPAGELKHGPLALVDENMPVVVIAPNDSLLDKVKNNMQEVAARGGVLFVFADADSDYQGGPGVHVIRTPRHIGILSAIVHTIPVQLLAYHVALVKGTDVDKPRNLAKSVTVE